MHVLDASVLGKLFLEEPGSAAFRDWFTAAMQDVEPLLVPTIAVVEVGRVLRRARRDLETSARAAVHEAVFDRLQEERPPMDACWRISETGVSFEDAQYLALAMEQQATLVTADGPLAKAARNAKLAVLRF